MNLTPGLDGSRLEINLTPLLDLVLQLIMFFMLTVNFVQADKINDDIDLPVAQSAMPLTPSSASFVVIQIGKNGERHAGGNKLDSKEQLLQYLRSRQAPGQGPVVVVLRAHKDTAWGEVWHTLEECSRAGYSSWQLRVIRNV
jgi:biopolymer transport protein ExbD